MDHFQVSVWAAGGFSVDLFDRVFPCVFSRLAISGIQACLWKEFGDDLPRKKSVFLRSLSEKGRCPDGLGKNVFLAYYFTKVVQLESGDGRGNGNLGNARENFFSGR